MTLEIKRRASMVLASIVAVVFAMTALLAGAAQAEEEGPTAVELGNIKPEEPSTITVHKYAEPKTGDANDGNEITSELTNDKLNGVEFILQKITCVNVTESTDWPIIAGLKVDAEGTVTKSDGSACTVDPAKTTQETADGKTTFNVKPGVFLVTEGADNGDNQITTKAAPFIVTVPFPSPDKNNQNKKDWNYNVHVYPKNSVTDVKKTVQDTEAVKAGDLVTWTVEAKIPEGDDLKNFHVSDTFDPRLTPKEVETVLAKVTTTNFVPADYTVERDGQTVKVVFTPKGVAKLNNTMKGKNIEVEFYTEVNSIGADGVIPNQATVFVDDPEENGDGFPSDEPDTEWGKITITKVDKDTGKKLSGAEFSVYLSEADAKAGKNAKAVIVTDDTGVASIIVHEGQYWVKETKAPAGYVLDPTIHAITINPEADGEGEEVLLEWKEQLTNDKSDVPELPLTGASGQLLMIVGGSAIILAALGLGLVAIKRRKA